MKTILGLLAGFFSAVPTAVSGKLNVIELLRTTVLAIGASGLTTCLVPVLTAISGNAAAIFPDQQIAAVVVGLITFVLDLIRRYGHGTPASLAQMSVPVVEAESDASVGEVYFETFTSIDKIEGFAARRGLGMRCLPDGGPVEVGKPRRLELLFHLSPEIIPPRQLVKARQLDGSFYVGEILGPMPRAQKPTPTKSPSDTDTPELFTQL